VSSLQAKLDAFRADLESGKPPYCVPRSVVEAMHRATAELKASGRAERAMKVGDRAPAFRLKDSESNVVSSSELLETGPLIVTFYRGVWCPYGNIELPALQAALPGYKKLGANNGLTFPILSDAGGEVCAAFGLKFRMPVYLVRFYKKAKIDLACFNDDPEWTLPMPARYVIGQSGIILYAEVNADYTYRPEPEELLPALRDAAEERSSCLAKLD
jgi:peroxiredoxin